MADPEFDRPAAVDAILGADVFGLLMEEAVRRGQPGEPTAQRSVFGWVLMGSVSGADDPAPSVVSAHHALTMPELDRQVRRFWDQEKVSDDPVLSPEEEQCEQLFRTTHRRCEDGRYMVRLPRRTEPPTGLGTSRHGALRLLMATERRLERDPSLQMRYREFMDTYLALGHMEPVPRGVENDGICYLPHHAVVKAADPGGKIRVVSNASFRTTSGVSLNDVLLPGPKLQPDLWLILARWRLFRWAFAADIVKMFRQIQVDPADAELQCVLWRAETAD